MRKVVEPAVDWLRANSHKTLEQLTADLQRGPIPSVAEYTERLWNRPHVVGPMGSLDTMLTEVEAQQLESGSDPHVQPGEYMLSKQKRPNHKSMDLPPQAQAEEQTSQKQRGIMERMVDGLLHRTRTQHTQRRQSRGIRKQRSQDQTHFPSQSRLPHPPQPEMRSPSTEHYSRGFLPRSFSSSQERQTQRMLLLEQAASIVPQYGLQEQGNHAQQAPQGQLPTITALVNRNVGRPNQDTRLVTGSGSNEQRGRIPDDQASSTIRGNPSSESVIVRGVLPSKLSSRNQ